MGVAANGMDGLGGPEDAAALPARSRQGAIRRRRPRGRGRDQSRGRRRRPGSHRLRPRPPAGGRRHGSRDGRGLGTRPRRHSCEPLLHLAGEPRRLCRRSRARRGCTEAPVHQPAADPERDRAALSRRPAHSGHQRIHDVVLDPGAALRPDIHLADGRRPAVKSASHRARRRRRLRLQARRVRRGGNRGRPRQEARRPGQVDRDPQRELPGHDPRPRPDPGCRDHRDARRYGTRPQGRPDHEHGCLSATAHPLHPAARPVYVPRHLQVRGPRPVVYGSVHEQDADRRLSRRWPSRGDLCDRADHGRARQRTGHGTARIASQELDRAGRVPLHDRGWARVRLRRLREGHGTGHRAFRVRRPAARAAGSP